MSRGNPGRSPASMTAEQWAWLDGHLRHAVGKHAGPVRSIVARARAKAEATVSLRAGDNSVASRVVLDLRANGPSRVEEITARLGAPKETVSRALGDQKRRGRVSRHKRVWSAATAPVRLVAR